MQTEKLPFSLSDGIKVAISRQGDASSTYLIDMANVEDENINENMFNPNTKACQIFALLDNAIRNAVQDAQRCADAKPDDEMITMYLKNKMAEIKKSNLQGEQE